MLHSSSERVHVASSKGSSPPPPTSTPATMLGGGEISRSNRPPRPPPRGCAPSSTGETELTSAGIGTYAKECPPS